MTSKVRHDETVVSGEVFEEEAPGTTSPAKAMEQNQRFSLSNHLICQSDTIHHNRIVADGGLDFLSTC